MKTFERVKDPEEVLDYVLDWSPELETAEKLATSAWAILPVTTPPLVEDDSDIVPTADKKARIWLSGGKAGEVYELTNTVVTDNAVPRTFEVTVKLKVKEK